MLRLQVVKAEDRDLLWNILEIVGCDANASLLSTDLNTGSFVSSSEALSSK